jgi:ketosteroid isomerase-like protein
MVKTNSASSLLRRSLTVLWLALAFGPASAADPADDAKIAEISLTLDQLHAAAAKADGKAYFDLFAPDAVFIGTDASERWTMDQFRGYALSLFAQGKGWTYKPRQRHITVARVPCSCVACFDEILDSASYGTSRGTGMLTQTPWGWKIEQYALTFPIPNDGQGHHGQDQGVRRALG